MYHSCLIWKILCCVGSVVYSKLCLCRISVGSTKKKGRFSVFLKPNLNIIVIYPIVNSLSKRFSVKLLNLKKNLFEVSRLNLLKLKPPKFLLWLKKKIIVYS